MYLLAIELLNYNSCKTVVAVKEEAVTVMYCVYVNDSKQVVFETTYGTKYVLQDHISYTLMDAIKAINV